MSRWSSFDESGEFRSDVPLCVSSRAKGRARCIRLRDGRFYDHVPGNFADLLLTPQNILVSDALATVLKRSCGASADFLPAEVIDLQSKKLLARYVEVRPHDELTPSTVRLVDPSGARAWHFHNAYLFVTSDVARAMGSAGFAEVLTFSPGFAGFVG
jgi:hypothetical protein